MKGQSKRTKAPKATAANTASRKRSTKKSTPARKRAAAGKTAKGARTARKTAAEAIEPDPYFLADPPAIERRKSPINGWGVFALMAR